MQPNIQSVPAEHLIQPEWVMAALIVAVVVTFFVMFASAGTGGGEKW